MRCAKGIFGKGILGGTGFSHRKKENPVPPKIPLPSWPKLLQNNSLEHFLFNVAATGVSLFARKQAKLNLLCKAISFVIFTKLIAPKHFLCKKSFFVIILAAMVPKIPFFCNFYKTNCSNTFSL